MKVHCRDALIGILKESSTTDHYPLILNYAEIFDDFPILGSILFDCPDMVLAFLDNVAKLALSELYESVGREDPLPGPSTRVKSGYSMKPNLYVRICSMPVCDDIYRVRLPSCKEAGRFLSLVGTVVRVCSPKLLKYSKKFACTKCSSSVDVRSIPSRLHSFPKNVKCPAQCENGLTFPVGSSDDSNSEPTSKFCDYQEIKLQELVQKMDFGQMPQSILVILHDDLINKCKPGDDVVITGQLYLRWKPFKRNDPLESQLVLLANYIQITNDQRSCLIVTEDMRVFVEEFWRKYKCNPFEGKKIIISSFCPRIYGMYAAKLALILVLVGGVPRDVAGSHIRGESHFLMVGDPGTGKSQLLTYVSKLIPRSAMTTGMGTTSAGLTASAVKDAGEWHLEAGVLVLADGGLCCIDEFECMKEHDRVSIHEAMEQKTISIAKAGMVVKLPTRVTVVAATNAKGKYKVEKSLADNTGLSSPLISQFDVVMVLRDVQEDSWDRLISYSEMIVKYINNIFMYALYSFMADFILGKRDTATEDARNSPDLWDEDRLKTYLIRVKDLKPKMTPQASKVISAYYQYQRSTPSRDPSRTTVRLLESLRRLSEAHARFMNRDIVTLHDVITVIPILEVSTEQSSFETTGNAFHTVAPDNPMEEYRQQGKLILTKLKLEKLWADEQEFLDFLDLCR